MDSAERLAVLVIEDDAKTAAALRLYLEDGGFEVSVSASGSQGLAAARTRRFDALILDGMLPGLDGYDVLELLRRESDVPVLMLTARSQEDSKLKGLQLGADDYITKPFSPRELVARLRAVLRRSRAPGILRAGNLSFDRSSREARYGDALLALTPTESKLLEVLMAAPDRVFSRDRLVELAMGNDYDGQERTVDAHIVKLRRKIRAAGGNPDMITTVYGSGYKLNRQAGLYSE